jgi:hypothetical protein
VCAFLFVSFVTLPPGGVLRDCVSVWTSELAMEFDFIHALGVGEDPINQVLLVVDKEGDVKAKIWQNRAHRQYDHRRRGLLIHKHGTSVQHDSRPVVHAV